MNRELQRAVFVEQLSRRGYPSSLALRVAMTPPLAVSSARADDDSRPGLEIAEALDVSFGRVVRLMAALVPPIRLSGDLP